MEISRQIADELTLPRASVEAVLELLADDCTVPFIARYRKEKTGNRDEVEIVRIRDRFDEIQQLNKRKDAVIASLRENETAPEALLEAIRSARTLTEVEDLYLPYRPKRRTRATIALENGCGPISELVFSNVEPSLDLLKSTLASSPKLSTIEDLLAGARDIVAEKISESKDVRERLRALVKAQGILAIKKAKGSAEDPLYAGFYQKEESLKSIPSHRLLAILRGVEESKLSVKIVANEQDVFRSIVAGCGFGKSVETSLRQAIEDSWDRLIQPSLENELLKETKLVADQTAIQVFSENLCNLLLAPPLGQKTIVSVDPGLRTGCKIVVLSAQGALLEHSVVYPLEPYNKTSEAQKKIESWIVKYRVEAIAVGNGTGGRETFDFLSSRGWSVPIVSVSESGASVYSASEIAREEFPDFDLTVRGAISIGRRLLDPLAELVKIDPKSIGVGQYQHDVDQKLLKKNLDDVVVSCVNKVGVDVNTASKPILTYISGLNAQLASRIVEHRTKNGPFRSRTEFLKIKGMGAKTFEQAAGFLRIRDGQNPLDASAVHPESYAIVETIARELKTSVKELVGKSGIGTLVRPLKTRIGVSDVVFDDLVEELEKPGLDPRRSFEHVSFDPNVRKVSDLKEGQILHGIVTNVTAFGAFVDVGVHQDGLVHISQLADRYVKDPFEVVKVGQAVRVRVTGVDVERKRIALSLKDAK